MDASSWKAHLMKGRDFRPVMITPYGRYLRTVIVNIVFVSYLEIDYRNRAMLFPS